MRLALEHLYDWQLPSSIWLPLHFYFIQFVYKVFNSLDFVVYITSIMGALIFNVIYSLVINLKNINETNRVFYLVLIFLLGINPMFIYLSMTGLSEIFFLFSLVFVIKYFVEYIHLDKNIFYFIGASFISTTIRYEAWFLVCLLILVLVAKNFKKEHLKLLLLGIFPLVWSYIQYDVFGDPIKWINTLEGDVLYLKQNKLFYFDSFWRVFFPVVIFSIGLIPFYWEKINLKKYWRMNLVIFVFIIFSMTQILFGKVEDSIRYNIPSLFLLGLFFILNLNLKKELQKKTKAILISSFILTPGVSMIEANKMYKDLSPSYMDNLVKEVKSLPMNDKAKIFVPRNEWVTDILKIKADLVNSPYLINLNEDEKYASYHFKAWEFYMKNKVLENKDLKYVAIIKRKYTTQIDNNFILFKEFSVLIEEDEYVIFSRKQ